MLAQELVNFPVRCYRFLIVAARYIRLFFPAFLFVFLSFVIFFNMPQARDMLAISAEHEHGPLALFGFVFGLAYITWYTSILVTYVYQFKKHRNHLINPTMRIIPKVLGMLQLTIPGFALLSISYADISNGAYYTVFVSYVLVVVASLYLIHVRRYHPGGSKQMWIASLIVMGLAMLMNGVITMDEYTANLRISAAVLLTGSIVFIYYTSAKFLDKNVSGGTMWAPFQVPGLASIMLPAWERYWFATLNAVSAILAAFFIAGIFSLEFARWLGPYSIPFLGFTFFLGIGNLISFVSRYTRVKWHVLIIALGIGLGYFNEPYWIRRFEGGRALFQQRMSPGDFIRHRIAYWKKIPVSEDIPVFIVLADGGASRSGLWASSMLGQLQAAYGASFSDNLLSLSGTSGGAVGVSAYYALLDSLGSHGSDRFRVEAEQFFGSDFLSFTLFRMIGADLIGHVLPQAIKYDRATSLEISMENASTPIIGQGFGGRMSSLVERFGQDLEKGRNMPALLLNSTRLRDGRPAIVSNIQIDGTFNERMDMLAYLDRFASEHNRNDLRLSSAAVVCSRFPYVSPAGRIGNSYFIDGGYFDNSGAGATHELLTALFDALEDDPYGLEIASRLRFVVVHCKNNVMPVEPGEKLHPVVNDLLAPVIGIASVRSSQTRINDSRLLRFLKRRTQGKCRYIVFNLLENASGTNLQEYLPHDEEDYSMNWVLSKKLQVLMAHEATTQFDDRKKEIDEVLNGL